MAILEIRKVPDPVLRLKAKRVRTADASVQKLIRDMLETVHADKGRAGLAAPQVGVSLRVAVISIPEEGDFVIVNPEIVKSSDLHLISEGCLSIPGYYGYIERAESVTVKARDATGKEVRIKGKGLLAQALQHEIDHLNGILFIDHLKSPEELHPVE